MTGGVVAVAVVAVSGAAVVVEVAVVARTVATIAVQFRLVL